MRTTYQPETRKSGRSVADNARSRGVAFPAVSAFRTSGGIIQRAQIRTGVSEALPHGTRGYAVPEGDILAALYKKFTGFALEDFPQTPRIESASNATRLNRSVEGSLGDVRTLGDKPINDLWQLVMDFKKGRALAAVNLKSKGGVPLASAVYNQYGKTQARWENTDVMIYKHPEAHEEEEEQTASDKGVSYKLAATKFKELREGLEWRDEDIAEAVLQYYKDGKVPKDVVDEGQTRNFGYITILMTVPESARSIGTFPLGLIMLDNIKTGKDTADAAFLPNAAMTAEVKNRVKARKKEKGLKAKENAALERGDTVEPRVPDARALVNKYKDSVDLGGTYAPAFGGSKAPLNQMEQASEEDTLEPSTGVNKGSYYWNETLKRYVQMVKKFLEANPALLSIEAEMDGAASATDALIEKMLVHFGIGEGIVTDTTRRREVARTTNESLHNLHETITTSFQADPPTPGSPLGDYEELIHAQHQDTFNDRASVKKEVRAQETLKRTFHPEKQKEALERRKREKEVVRNTIVEFEDQKRPRHEKKEDEPVREKKKIRLDYEVVAVKQRLAQSIGGIVVTVIESLGAQTDPEFLFAVVRKHVLVAYGSIIDQLKLPGTELDTMIEKALDPFLG